VSEKSEPKKPKATPCFCIECGSHFSDDPKLQGRLCPACSKVPSPGPAQQFTHDRLTEMSRRAFSK
jgi:hypothetical protein